MKVELVDHMGSDLSVVNAARVSFAKQSDWDQRYFCDVDEYNNPVYSKEVLVPEDAKLIKYLAKHNHWTPFAHTAISLRVGAPVPIRTQCFKHKAGFVENEESRRYIGDEPELYIPPYFRKAPENGAKQGSVDEEAFWSVMYKANYIEVCSAAINLYKAMIKDHIAPEQARFVLPQGVIVNWIWTGNLASYARFYNLRTDPHAQKEVGEIAYAIGNIMQDLYPVSWKALTKGEGELTNEA